MAQYMECTGVPTRRARVPWAADLDGYTAGFFLAARVRSDDIKGFADQQTIASMWRGPDINTSLTFMWFLETDGTFKLTFEETTATQLLDQSGDIVVDKGITDGEEFWIGVSVRFDGGAHTQWYYGGLTAKPVWGKYGTESTDAGVTDLRTDSSNDLTVGDTRHNTGPEDEWFGDVFEYVQFSADFPNIGAANLEAWFNAEDFALNDGDTDTAVGGAGKTWTLASGATMILDDVAVPTGGLKWWLDQDITPSLVSQLLAGVDPALTTGNVNLTPALVSQLLAGVAPAITTGNVNLTPSLVRQLLAGVAPTITPGVAISLVGSDVARFYRHNISGDERLILVVGFPRGTASGFGRAETWDVVSGAFALPAVPRYPASKKDAMNFVFTAWDSNKTDTQAVLTAALNSALITAGYTRPDGKAIG